MDDDVRRELDQLHQADRDLRTAIGDLDSHGSRGVLQLHGQVTDLIRDLADVKLSITTHERQHDEEARDRRNGRRWMIGTALAASGGFGTVIAFLVDIAKHLH